MFFISISSLFIVNASCNSQVALVKVQSGGEDLGYFQTSDSIFILDNFSQNPLKLELLIESVQDNCIENSDQVLLRLFPSGSLVQSNGVETQFDQGKNLYLTKAFFEFNFEGNLPSSFNSNFLIETLDSQSFSGQLTFIIDREVPIILISKSPTQTNLLAPNTSININYEIIDSGSGLKTLRIDNGDRIFLQGNYSYEGSISEKLMSSKTFKIEAEDMLGNYHEEEIEFKVDNIAPVISNINKIYSFDGVQKVSFSIDVTDESFNFTDNVNVLGYFKNINSIYDNQEKIGNCIRKEETIFTCSWNNLIIDLEKTTTVGVGFIAFDVVGNNNSIMTQEEIFLDNSAPRILEFYTLNDLGVKNVFSANSKEFLVKLEVEDDSLIINPENKLTLFERFGQFLQVVPECSLSGKKISCTYNLTNHLKIYSLIENDTLIFDLAIRDTFSNPTQTKLNVTLDNKKPEIKSVELIETESVKDEIIRSGERINFRIMIKDDNLFFENNHFIYGNFSTIDFRDGQDKVEGSCRRDTSNISLVRCDFNSIVVQNGYFKRNVSFYVYDVAGNLEVEKQEVEVLKISDEQLEHYNIDLIKSTPINRNVISRGPTTGWFEGKVKLKVQDSDIRLINFQIQSCNERDLNPISVIDFQLFPQDVVFARNSEQEMPIVFKINVRDLNTGLVNLNVKTMQCSIAILKRDSTQVYPPEIVNVSLSFQFFDLPRGDLLKSHSIKVLELIEDTEFLGEWFDKTYDIYKIFDNVCSVVGTANGLMSSISLIWYYISMILDGFTPYTTTPNMAISKGLFGSDSALSKLFNEGPLKKMCDWVTCSNGATLLGAVSGYSVEDVPGLNSLYSMQDSIAQYSCGFDTGNGGN